MPYDEYVAVEVLDRGGFGDVYKAVEATGFRPVALKLWTGGVSGSSREDMKKEFELMKPLRHENIVRVYDFIAIEGMNPAIVMELLQEGSLKHHLHNFGFRLFETAVREYAIGALRGLEYLHSNNVLHCDIKPENIMLSGSTVKLCDFGASKQCDVSSAEGHHTKDLLGSPLYMAPEIVKHQTYTQASDMWSLGCTLVELASGKNPWAAVAPPVGAPLFAILVPLFEFFHDPEYDPATVVPGHLTAPLRGLLCRMLDLDPSKRPTAAECLQSPYFLKGDAWKQNDGMELPADYKRLIGEARANGPIPIVETGGTKSIRAPLSDTISTDAPWHAAATDYNAETNAVSVDDQRTHPDDTDNDDDDQRTTSFDNTDDDDDDL